MSKDYLALADEEIDRRQEEVHAECKVLIENFKKRPFWERWANEESHRQEIIFKWKRFEFWMNQRMREKRDA